MKALFAVIFCAMARGMVGESVSWPGGAVSFSSSSVNNLVNPSTKSFAYSTSQYINAFPASYLYGIRPQLAYPTSQVTTFAPSQGFPAYYPVFSPSYIPSSLIYPQISPIAAVQPQPVPSPPGGPIAPIAPSAPSPPEQSNQPPSPSDQSYGDADTTVIESAEFVKSQEDKELKPKSDNANQLESTDSVSANSNKYQQHKESVNPLYRNPQIVQQASFAPIPQLSQGIPQYSQLPRENSFLQLPEFPQLPQLPELPQFIQCTPSSQAPQSPSVPQLPPVQNEPSQQQPQIPQLPLFPQFPPSQSSSSQQLPQLPSFPQLPSSQGSSSSQQIPQLPAVPQFPSSQLPSFPSADNSNKVQDDEDTVAVESA